MINDKTKQEKWKQIITACKGSGLSIKTYCRNNGLSYPQYKYWSDVIRQAQVSSTAEANPMVVVHEKPDFIPVTIPAVTKPASELPELFLRVGGFEVLVRRVP